MKVTGPGSGAPGGPEAPGDPTQAAAPDQAGRPDAPASERGVNTVTAEIAAELAAGKLAPQAALERVVELVIDKQLGAGAPASIREKLRAALHDTLESDPFLAEKLREIAR